MSIDGRIGLKNGESKWISNIHARESVHLFRAGFDAIIVGGNTLRQDNPVLTSRGIKKVEPLRVVFTKTLDLPVKANFWDKSLSKTLVVFDESKADQSYLKRIPPWVEIENLPSDDPRLLLALLAKKGCNKVLWECGSKLATAAIKSGCVQEFKTFIAPKIIGGLDAMTPISELNFCKMSEVLELNRINFQIFGNDICLDTEIK